MPRKLITAALAALALVVAPAAATADPCDESLLRCDWSQGGTYFPVEATSISGIVPLRTDNGTTALDTYRALVRAPYEMPAQPAVGVWFTDATLPHSVGPWRPAAFTEATIAIRVKYRGEEGWYHLSEPTNSAGAHDLGRGVGFPKYMATTTFDGSRATATKGTRQTFDLRFTPGGGTASAELRDWTLMRAPYFSHNPVFTGDPTRVKYTVKPYVPAEDATFGVQPDDWGVAPVTALEEPRTGSLDYTLDGDLDTIEDTLPDIFPAGRTLADVIATQGTVTGQHWHGEGMLLIQSRKLEG